MKRKYVILDDEKYILLKLEEYTSLVNQIKGGCITMISQKQMLFLCAVMEELGKPDESSLTVIGENATLYFKNKNGDVIHSAFDMKLCEKYYNHVSKFIEEVL